MHTTPPALAPVSARTWRAPGFMLLGLAAGFFDAVLLRRLGISFAINGWDGTWIIGAYFGVSFAGLGWLLAAQLATRERERAANGKLREQSELLEATRRRLAQSDKLAALGQLAAAIAHEVRNPLGVIRSAAQSVAEVAVDDDGRRAASFIVSEADRLNAVVGSILAFAKPLQVQRRPARVAEIVARAVELVREEAAAKRVALRPSPAAALPELIADPDLLTQALLGLLHNAVESSTAGGAVELDARCDGSQVRIEVSDSGPGIPEPLRARIFEPFFTTRRNGTGLGLAIVRQIVEAHRGTIGVSTAAAGGACFTLRLPLEATA